MEFSQILAFYGVKTVPFQNSPKLKDIQIIFSFHCPLFNSARYILWSKLRSHLGYVTNLSEIHCTYTKTPESWNISLFISVCVKFGETTWSQNNPDYQQLSNRKNIGCRKVPASRSFYSSPWGQALPSRGRPPPTPWPTCRRGDSPSAPWEGSPSTHD